MIETVIEIVTAIATVGTVLVALYQLSRTIKLHDRDRDDDLYSDYESKAFLVDAWVAVEGGADGQKERVIMIRNGTAGPIRDVSLRVLWPMESKDQEMLADDCELAGRGAGKTQTEERVPDRRTPWQILPQGLWRVSRKKGSHWGWDFPKMVSEDEAIRYEPQFSVGDRHKWICHRILELRFIDTYGNKWSRLYRIDPGGEGTNTEMLLRSTRRKSLEPYASPEPMAR